MTDASDQVRNRHIPEARLYAYAHGELIGEASVVEDHLASCLVCRVRLNRLRGAKLPPIDEATTRALVEAEVAVPELLQRSLSMWSADSPQVGDLWRVGTSSQAFLVWIRRVLDESALVIPVALEDELADEYSLIVPKDESLLGVDVILLTTVEGQIDRRSFIQRIGELDVADKVSRLREARREGRAADGDCLVGSSIDTVEDQRIEYQQLVADLLGDCSPEAYALDEATDVADDFDLAAYWSRVAEIAWRRPDARVESQAIERVEVEAGHELLAVGRVVDPAASVVMALLIGPRAPDYQSLPSLAESCGELMRKHHECDWVAVSVPDSDWTTVALDVTSTISAIEPPSGERVPPRVPGEPLPVVDALFKLLDGRLVGWEDREVSEMDESPLDMTSSIPQFAQEAVQRLVASGRRSASPKKEVYVSFGEAEMESIAALVQRVIAGEEIQEVLDEFLESGGE